MVMTGLAMVRRVDEPALRGLGARAIARPAGGSLHLIVAEAEALGLGLAA